jgi:hypothetical protein
VPPLDKLDLEKQPVLLLLNQTSQRDGSDHSIRGGCGLSIVAIYVLSRCVVAHINFCQRLDPTARAVP